MPAFSVMSSSFGTARPLHLVVFAPGRGGGGTGCPPCAHAMSAACTLTARSKISFPSPLACVLLKLPPMESGSRLLLRPGETELTVAGLEFLVELEFAISVGRARLFAIRGLKLVMDVVRLWTQTRGFLQMGDRFFDVALIQQNLAELVLCVCMFGMGGNNRPEESDSFAPSRLLQEGKS